MTTFEQQIKNVFGVSNTEMTVIQSFFKPKVLQKGDYFIKSGQTSGNLGFLQKGMLREFVVVGDKEITKWISTEGSFVVDLKSFVFKEPARWNMQALTYVELLVLQTSDYHKLTDAIPHWPEIEKMFIAKCFTIIEERVLQHLSLTADERYNQLFAYNKHLFNQVPLQYFASMLGMTPETLSRIRRKSSS